MHPPTRRRQRSALIAVLTIACGCTDGSMDEGPCNGNGEETLRVRPNRLEIEDIGGGSELPVFPPPQGGVFTELDVRATGVAVDDIDWLRFRLDDAAGATIANQQYRGSALPWECLDDGTLVVNDVPVGLDASVVLDALDGQDATLSVAIDLADRDITEQWAVVLRKTG